MKLIGTEVGRVVRIVPVEEMRPLSGVHPPSAMRMLAERYNFSHIPDLRKPWDEVQKEGFKFQLGKLSYGDRTIGISELTFYNDGVVATASTTDDAEIILSDILVWGKEALGFRDAPSLRTLYLSILVVEFDHSPNALLDQFLILSETLGKLLHATYGITFPVELHELALSYDRSVATPAWQSLAKFVIERRITHPYTQNRFYTEAPLGTRDHLALLETLESTLKHETRSPSKKGK